FAAARSVEIGGRLLDQRHAVAEQVGEDLRACQPLTEGNGPVDRLLRHSLRLTLRRTFLTLAPAPGGKRTIAQAGHPVQRSPGKASDIVAGEAQRTDDRGQKGNKIGAALSIGPKTKKGAAVAGGSKF